MVDAVTHSQERKDWAGDDMTSCVRHFMWGSVQKGGKVLKAIGAVRCRGSESGDWDGDGGEGAWCSSIGLRTGDSLDLCCKVSIGKPELAVGQDSRTAA